MHRARVVFMRQIGIEQFDRQRITKTFGSRTNFLCCAGRVRRNRDAMPGKQMAIDADLNSGLIDQDEARLRREESPALAGRERACSGGGRGRAA